MSLFDLRFHEVEVLSVTERERPNSPVVWHSLAALALSVCPLLGQIDHEDLFPAARPPGNHIQVENRVPIPMRDGAILKADIYRPAGEGKYPVLVSRTPYGTERAGRHAAAVFFARRGYVFVFQDTRGRHESNGEWSPYRLEMLDGYDTIEWAARQSWSNGKVGMQGASYLGHVQWQAARTVPPHLVTVFPVVAMTSFYHHGVTTNGAFRLAMRFGWGAVRNDDRLMQNTVPHFMENGPESISYEKVLWHLPLVDIPRLVGRNPTFWRDWVTRSDYTDYWKAINAEVDFHKIPIPAHTFGGWFDVNLMGTLNGYAKLSKRGKTAVAREKSRMIIGPWGHGPARRVGHLDFGDHANIDTRSVEIRWFDYWLKGVDTGIQDEPPVTVYVMGKNVWRRENEYPLARTEYRKLYLHSDGKANSYRGDGRLSWDPPAADSRPDRYRYDPHHPVPSLGGNNCCGADTPIGPVDQRPIEGRNDILVYTSEFLKEEVEVTGPVKVVLYAASDAKDTDFVAKLVDVYPDGRAVNVAEGILRARHREGLDKPKLMEPGRIYEMSINLIGTSNAFLPGHRIRVDITSSHFPQFNRNLNTGETVGLGSKPVVAHQTIHHSSERPSHILLPVIPAE